MGENEAANMIIIPEFDQIIPGKMSPKSTPKLPYWAQDAYLGAIMANLERNLLPTWPRKLPDWAHDAHLGAITANL